MTTYGGRKKSFPSHKTLQLAGKVVEQNGELGVHLFAPQLRRHFLKTYCKPGDHMSITMVNKRPKRSVAQNNFYHVYLGLVSLSSGHTMDELKAWVKEKKLSKGVREVYGEKVRMTESTADLNISEFVEMMNWIEEKTGVPIPDPTEFGLAFTKDEYDHLKYEQTEKYRKIKAKPIIKKTKKKHAK